MSFWLDESLFTLAEKLVELIVKQWRSDWARRKQDVPLADLVLEAEDSPAARRRLDHELSLIADQLSERLAKRFASDFSVLADDAPAIVSGLADLFTEADLQLDSILSADVDPKMLAETLAALRPDIRDSLSASGGTLYDLVLRTCCEYVVEAALELPVFQTAATQELLTRTSALYRLVSEIFDRMPVVPAGFASALPDEVFAEDYRLAVVRKLDNLRLFGIDTPARLQRYPLSIAYISLSVANPTMATPDAVHRSTHVRVEAAVSKSGRCLIRGEAGSGKTTLLSWLAVQAARRSFTGQLAPWNQTVPFFLSLRQYVDQTLPQPHEFVTALVPSLSPPGAWIESQLRLGRGLILVDGLDELPELRREEVREWISDLVATYPRSRFVVTTRPPAASAGWLATDDFDELILQPMSVEDVRRFVAHWHQAAKAQPSGSVRGDELDALQIKLRGTIEDTPHLGALASTPLMCAMLCSLNRDRPGGLPRYRTELYRIALEMLLDRRERERRVPRALLPLERGEIEALLQQLAYWLVLNNQVQLTATEAASQITHRLTSLPHAQLDEKTALSGLLSRTGLLREPVVGVIDFVHKTFQEYFAAAEIRTQNHIPMLLQNAEHDGWREVLVLTAGLATTTQREQLVAGLLEIPRDGVGSALTVAAIECLGASAEMSEELADASREAVRSLVPPRSTDEARALAVGGDDIVASIRSYTDADPSVASSCVRCLGYIGTPRALETLSSFAHAPHPVVAEALLDMWDRFDAMRYAEEVLADMPLADDALTIQDVAFLLPSTRLRHCHRLECDFAGTLPEPSALAVTTALWKVKAADAGTLSDFAALGEQPLLEEIAFGDASALEVAGPANLFPNLRSLTLSTSRKLSEVAPFQNLEQLSLNEAPRLELMDSVSRLTELKHLAFSRGRPPEPGIEYVRRGPMVVTPKSDDPDRGHSAHARPGKRAGEIPSLHCLDELENLETLKLEWIDELKDIGGAEAFPRLKELSLRHCSHLVDVTAIENLLALEYIDFSGCGRLNSIPSLSPQSRVAGVSLNHCSTISTLAFLVSICGQLTQLGLRGVRECELSLIADAHSVRSVDISETDFTDAGLLGGLGKLRSLGLAFCNGLHSINALTRCTQLRELDIRGPLLSADLGDLTSSTSLEVIRVSQDLDRRLSTLSGLPRLRQVEIEGDVASLDISALTARGITVVQLPRDRMRPK
jgi:hypothetical protein